MKISNRGIHRDFAYFYFGLIIAFSFSGIILNHRQDWYPMDYTYEAQDVSIVLPEDKKQFNDKQYLRSLASRWDLQDAYENHRIREGKLRVYFKGNTILDLNTSTGQGLLESKRKVPILGHSMYLHKSTDNFWIWYSDIFGLAMMVIALTGTLIPVGKNGFRDRGWKLAVMGMLFPLLFLFILS